MELIRTPKVGLNLFDDNELNFAIEIGRKCANVITLPS